MTSSKFGSTSRLHPTHYNTSVFFVQFINADFRGEMSHRQVPKARERVLYSVHYYHVSPRHYELFRLQAD